MADGPGEYTGRAAEINGDGFADMIFSVKSTSRADFEKWVASVKNSPNKLNKRTYSELLKPSKKEPIVLYSSFESDIFNNAVMKYLQPGKAP